LSEFNETLIFLDRFSKNAQNIKFHDNPSNESRFIRTDMTMLIVAFRNFAKAPKSEFGCMLPSFLAQYVDMAIFVAVFCVRQALRKNQCN
jgi:hypothetical protein